jgi:hypothetical protein
MQDLEELLAQMADARKIYGKEPVAPYHGSNHVWDDRADRFCGPTRCIGPTDAIREGSTFAAAGRWGELKAC